MPGPGHKFPPIMDRCVRHVIASGKPESNAYAICRSQLGLAEDGSEDQKELALTAEDLDKKLIAAGYPMNPEATQEIKPMVEEDPKVKKEGYGGPPPEPQGIPKMAMAELHKDGKVVCSLQITVNGHVMGNEEWLRGAIIDIQRKLAESDVPGPGPDTGKTLPTPKADEKKPNPNFTDPPQTGTQAGAGPGQVAPSGPQAGAGQFDPTSVAHQTGGYSGGAAGDNGAPVSGQVADPTIPQHDQGVNTRPTMTATDKETAGKPDPQHEGATGSAGTIQTTDRPGADHFPGVGDPHQSKAQKPVVHTEEKKHGDPTLENVPADRDPKHPQPTDNAEERNETPTDEYNETEVDLPSEGNKVIDEDGAPEIAAGEKREDVNPEEGKKKYGDVEYADPTNNKYPIDTSDHIHAAWSYINMPKNAKKYADGGKAIKSKIIAAWKKKIDPNGPPSEQDEKKAAICSALETRYRALGMSWTDAYDAAWVAKSLKALMNPNHDEKGQFAEGPGSGGGERFHPGTKVPSHVPLRTPGGHPIPPPPESGSGKHMQAVHGHNFSQIHYETGEPGMRQDAMALRKAGFNVHATSMGEQVTPVGRLKVSTLTVRPGTEENMAKVQDIIKGPGNLRGFAEANGIDPEKTATVFFSAPSLSPQVRQEVEVGGTLTIPVKARNFTGDATTMKVEPFPLPKNAEFDSTTGTFTFTPSMDQVGSYDFIFTASDGIQQLSQSVIVTVKKPEVTKPGAVKAGIAAANAHQDGKGRFLGGHVSALGHRRNELAHEHAKLQVTLANHQHAKRVTEAAIVKDKITRNRAAIENLDKTIDQKRKAAEELLARYRACGLSAERAADLVNPPDSDPEDLEFFDIEVPDFVVGKPNSFTVSGHDEDGDPVEINAEPGCIPLWAEYDKDTGVFHGTPTEAGSWTCTFILTDGVQEAKKSVTVKAAARPARTDEVRAKAASEERI